MHYDARALTARWQELTRLVNGTPSFCAIVVERGEDGWGEARVVQGAGPRATPDCFVVQARMGLGQPWTGAQLQEAIGHWASGRPIPEGRTEQCMVCRRSCPEGELRRSHFSRMRLCPSCYPIGQWH